ncbi:group II intron maturase-specific domain-containing protein [candidate division CSSED10-310 bacterium]|uniref:Group II intron maturase-specific domain-containing protein n=1 Tax=candidate division CSSED10-310 bacterium TaxID=2855610 RepID=A0ABV6YRV1_UNCC1
MLIKRLNQTLRGWGNYHRYVVSSGVFRSVDNYVYHQLWRLVRRRHRN